MIDYAKKSSVALWKTRGNPFARYHTKDWGMAWILEQVPIEEGMAVLDVGHGRNEQVADFFLSKGCTFYAMDKITAPQRPGSSLPEFDDLRNYADELERRGGFYIDVDKWGRTIEGIPALSPDRIREIDPDLVIVTTMFHTSVVAELEYVKAEYGLEFDIRIV